MARKPMPQYKRIAPRLKKLWFKPLQHKEIAERLGVSTNVITYAAAWLGLPPKQRVDRNGLSTRTKLSKALRLRNEGFTFAQIGELLFVRKQRAFQLVKQARAAAGR